METPRLRRAQPMGFAIPIGTDAASVRARVIAMERLLERSLVIPGIRMPVGLDAVLGLVPVLGDVLAAAMGAYILWEARNLGLPKWKLARMGANVLFDTAIGAIPLIGDAADVLYRSNTKNLKILLRHLDAHHPETRVIEG
ncbi:DUF4112 domain-containing protein [Erythrobacter sp. WG]|uniref:DUF4112 domain-containing protein n=1 Tax=Erythrobacter sp. WG TaxID=2985510 RepID=UPI002271D36F|nr:DUF4112 domain-containing protein [Erythrobacter sp. WG]MCX9145873.1 DUF4112 domain-containing protein [Erythrobacter sp. WG]